MVDGAQISDTYPTPEHGWTCFHCGDHFPGTFAGHRKARDHFGPTPERDPACAIDARQLRLLEDELARYRDEDTELHRKIARLHSDHVTALRREEEKGYALGVRDRAEEGVNETPGEEPDSYTLGYALNLARLWGAGKLIGGDEGAVISALLAEIDRLRAVHETGENHG